MLLVALALGAADPPRAGARQWHTDSTAAWPLLRQHGDTLLYDAPAQLPTLPFTLELSVLNSGAPDSAWGIWLQTESRQLAILVSSEGYFSVSEDDRPRWQQFIHLRPGAANRLYLHHAAPDEPAVLRLNDEIAWQGDLGLSPSGRWGLLTFRQPQLSEQAVSLYYSGER